MTETVTIPVADVSVSAETVWAYAREQIGVSDIAVVARPMSGLWVTGTSPTLKTIYVCEIVTSGLVDLELPMATFTAIMRNGSQSYLSVVVPNITDYETAINLRSSGEIIIKKGTEGLDGTRNLEPIISVNFDSLRLDEGSSNASGTLVGYRQRTYTDGVAVILTNVSYRAVEATGGIRLRADVDLFIRPGDICTYGTSEFQIDSITYYVTPNLAYMEVAE